MGVCMTAAVAPVISGLRKSPSQASELPRRSDRAAVITRRSGILGGGAAAIALSLSLLRRANAAILEADDDVELLEKVKKDREKRLARQGVISSSGKETGYLQDLVYKLSKVGQAIENSDLSVANSVLGSDANADWVRNVNTAFNKLSSSTEEKTEIEAFKTSLASLFSSVKKQDVESSKQAFVSSASALEKWVELAGLVGRLKGL